jgi:hypothetical protein
MGSAMGPNRGQNIQAAAFATMPLVSPAAIQRYVILLSLVNVMAATSSVIVQL